jgi:hypothetical protein
MLDFLDLQYANFVLLAPFVALIAGWINAKVHVEGWMARAVSWLVAAIAVAVGYFYDLGYLADLKPAECLLEAIGIGLMANGVFTIDAFKNFLHRAKATQPSVARHKATSTT